MILQKFQTTTKRNIQVTVDFGLKSLLFSLNGNPLPQKKKAIVDTSYQLIITHVTTNGLDTLLVLDPFESHTACKKAKKREPLKSESALVETVGELTT